MVKYIVALVCLVNLSFASNYLYYINQQPGVVDISFVGDKDNAYNEMFIEVNGEQVIATSQFDRVRDLGTENEYVITLDDVKTGDEVKFRAYYHKENAEAQFAPGEDAGQWLSFTYSGITRHVVSADYIDQGTVKVNALLPTGQQWVEVFVRVNGQQVIAGPVMNSGEDNGDGTTTYSVTRSGLSVGDVIEYRAYSYLPGKPGTFTPGTTEQSWETLTFGTLNTTDGVISTENFEDGHEYQIAFSKSSEFVMPAGHGWALYKATPQSITVPLIHTTASMKDIYVKKCAVTEGEAEWVPYAEAGYASYNSYEYVYPEVGTYYWYNPYTYNYWPGTRLNSTYACNAYPIHVYTYIGWQTLLTNGTVTFAYVIDHSVE
ncbi:MAG: hypothetical protein OCD01_17560 [Fibrobacterales bacterium]